MDLMYVKTTDNISVMEECDGIISQLSSSGVVCELKRDESSRNVVTITVQNTNQNPPLEGFLMVTPDDTIKVFVNLPFEAVSQPQGIQALMASFILCVVGVERESQDRSFVVEFPDHFPDSTHWNIFFRNIDKIPPNT